MLPKIKNSADKHNNDNDEEKRKDVRMTKRKVQRKQNGDEEVTNT